jgi:gas vesicle protein
MNDNDNDLGAFLAGFVIGGLVGAAVALILAPQSGEETRRRIVDMSDDLVEAGQQRVERVRDVADSYAHRTGDAFSEARGRAGEMTNQIQEQARIVLDAGKENVATIRSGVKDATSSMTDNDNATTESAA